MKNSWKSVGTLVAILGTGTIFAACATSETVTVAAGPGGSTVIMEECDSTVNCPQAQKAKAAMQPAAACKDKDGKCDEKAQKKSAVKVAKKPHMPLAEFENQASKLATTLAQAFKKGDAKAFVGALPENLRKDFDEKKFLEAHKMMTNALGEVISADFVTDLKHPMLSIRVWKIGFKKLDKDVGELTQQALFQVAIGEVDKKAQVVSFGFI